MDNSVSGFLALGTDNLGSEFARLSRFGFFPADFGPGTDYTLSSGTNEWGENISSVNFLNVTSAFEGFVGVYNSYRQIMLNDAASLGYSALTSQQATFWSYIYYQGEGRGRRWLTANGGFDFSGMTFDLNSQNPPDARSKAYRRLATKTYIDLIGF